MNLLMISGDRSLASGKKGAFYNTLEEFHKYWDQIDIITPPVSKSSVFNLFKPKIYKLKPLNYFGNVYIHPSPLPLMFQSLWILLKGLQIYKKYSFRLMTTHEYPPFYNGLGAKLLHWRTKVPYILEVMHIPGLPKAGNFKEWAYKWFTKLFIRLDDSTAKAVRIINQKQTKNFLKQSGIKESKLHYIPAFYIDLGVFRPMDVKKDFDLVFAARLEKNKGVVELLKAVAIIKKSKPDIKLLIVGSGPLKAKLEEFIGKNNLGENVIFSGWLETHDDVAKAYNSARIFVNPSYNEGGPRVVLEAMACGLPVITTPVGLMVDIIEHRQNGLLTEWNPGNMAKTILRLMEEEATQQKFTAHGLELVKQFEKHQAIKNYADKLKAIL